ncbi:hypothetical protein QOT17_006869 [Balamuthia mandrillaris]
MELISNRQQRREKSESTAVSGLITDATLISIDLPPPLVLESSPSSPSSQEGQWLDIPWEKWHWRADGERRWRKRARCHRAYYMCVEFQTCPARSQAGTETRRITIPHNRTPPAFLSLDRERRDRAHQLLALGVRPPTCFMPPHTAPRLFMLIAFLQLSTSLELLAPQYSFLHLATPSHTSLHLSLPHYTPRYTSLRLTPHLPAPHATPSHASLHLSIPRYTFPHLASPSHASLHLPMPH